MTTVKVEKWINDNEKVEVKLDAKTSGALYRAWLDDMSGDAEMDLTYLEYFDDYYADRIAETYSKLVYSGLWDELEGDASSKITEALDAMEVRRKRYYDDDK